MADGLWNDLTHIYIYTLAKLIVSNFSVYDTISASISFGLEIIKKIMVIFVREIHECFKWCVVLKKNTNNARNREGDGEFNGINRAITLMFTPLVVNM